VTLRSEQSKALVEEGHGGDAQARKAESQRLLVEAKSCIKRGVPVISVDTKKKELVGNFKNGGREWQPQGEPELVDVHDFPSDAAGSHRGCARPPSSALLLLLLAGAAAYALFRLN
jgi:hypothetical protein